MGLKENLRQIDWKQVLGQYWDSLTTDIPDYIFQILLSILCVGTVVFVIWKGARKGMLYSSRLLLMVYLIVVYCSTIFFRNNNETFRYDFHPLWSYSLISDGRSILLAENIMNVIVFLPIGLLIGLGFPKCSWWKTIGTGCFISITIEAMQFVTKRGFCEVDDVMHNTLGCAIGIGIIKLIMFAHSALCKPEL